MHILLSVEFDLSLSFGLQIVVFLNYEYFSFDVLFLIDVLIVNTMEPSWYTVIL